MRKALMYLVAYDGPGEIYYRCFAKMAVTSLFAAGWQGRVLLISNGKYPVFDRPHHRLREECISTEGQNAGCIAEQARVMKIRAAELIQPRKHSHIIYADADTLFNPAICGLLPSEPGVWVSREHWIPQSAPQRSAFFASRRTSQKKPMSSPDAGFWIVDAQNYATLMEEWRVVYQSKPADVVIEKRDRHAWNFLLSRTQIPVQSIYRHRVLYPLAGDSGIAYTNDAAVLHFCGLPNAIKFNFMFGKFMQGQTAERAALLLNSLEP